MKITVNVTEKHIARGDRSNCSRCPIALAMQDAGAVDWRVGRLYTYRPGDPLNQRDLPLEASAFIDDFDSARPVEPFSFTLELPA